MENQSLQKILIELRKMKTRLDEIKSDFADDSDDDLAGDVYEFLFGAADNLNDAIEILKNK